MFSELLVEGKVKKVVFVSITPYPNGLATTNRMVSLLSELPLHSWNVAVICLASTKFPNSIVNDKELFKRQGVHKDVSYRYISAFVKANKFKVLRLFSAFWGFIRLPIALKSENKNVDNPIFITNLTQVHYVIYFYLIKRFFGYKLILIRSEYPSLIRNKTIVTTIYKKFFESWVFKFFDGFVLMTSSLKDYFKTLCRKNMPLKIIPMTVDLDRFSGVHESFFPFKYIAYAGSLSNDKDGVDILIRSFIKIANDHKNIHLVIIGDTSKNNYLWMLNSIVSQSTESIKRRIHFTGLIDSSKIPSYLKNASLLALARPDSIQAQGGFPTKLGEYLATGIPVIVTKVGEIPFYLQHKKNAILCDPGDIDSFAENLDWALSNYEEAMLIGQRGKELAARVFCSKVQGEEFSKFLDTILAHNVVNY